MKCLIAVLLIITISPSICAQKAGSSAKKSTAGSKTTRLIYSEMTINPSAKTLPPGYLGHDGKKIFRALEERQKPKGEFESTAAYKSRLASDLARPIIGNLKISDNLFAFSLEPLLSEYDADKESLLVAAELQQVMGYGEPIPSLRGLRINSEGESLQEYYTGVSGLGAKVEVKKTIFTDYQIAVHNWKEWEAFDYIPPYARDNPIISKYSIKQTLAIPMTLLPAQAKVLKADLRLLTLCRITEPLISDGGSTIKPTIDKPRDTTILNKYIHVEILELWLYNERTGQILAKRSK